MAALDLPCCWLLRLHAPAGSLDFVFFVKLREPGDATAALYFVYYRQPAIRNPFSLIFCLCRVFKDVLYYLSTDLQRLYPSYF